MGGNARAVFLLLLAAVFWSTSGVIVKLTDWPALAIISTRSFCAAGFLYLFLRRQVKFTWSKDQILAAVCYAGVCITFVTATKLTTAANAIFMQYTAPVWVALAGPVLVGERTTRLDWVFTVVCMGGMGLFFLDQLGPTGLAGLFCGIGTGISFALFTILVRRQREGSSAASLVLGNVIACVVTSPALFWAPMPSGETLLGVVLLGLLSLTMGYICYAAALKHVGALEGVLIPALEPILNPIWVMLLHGETPGPWALGGGAVILAMVTLRGLLTARSAPRLGTCAPGAK